LGPKYAGKVQTSADVGTAAAMWMPVRLSGRLFQTAGAAAAKALSLIVERCVRRPTSAEFVAEVTSPHKKHEPRQQL